MNLVSKCLIVLVAVSMVFGLAGNGVAKSSSDRGNLTFAQTRAQIGKVIGLDCQYNLMPAAATVHFFVGTDSQNGTTTITVDGITTLIPVANAVEVGTANPIQNNAHFDYTVPRQQQLVGTSMRAIAVVVVNGVVIMSNFAISGPILGDDIS